MMMPAGTARAEDPLGQADFLTKSAEGVPAAFIHQQAEFAPLHDKWTALNTGFFYSQKSPALIKAGL
ncbi:hypothetical protein [Halobacillus litoralis]|uniref:hypothetical protein n=1 Tax=Halobacillus litoralis TaxID=45668 RepID=UPI001CD761A4|nr:hypothetical protein [Halobacillus litoralis]MCA1020981.1 hypothetical protein [Halobacillus litoralis]